MGLSLNDNDSLKTPTALGNTDVTLKTPTVLGSPTKGPFSAGTHVDELITPKLSLNNFSTPNIHTQAFFGEHEPLLTANIEISTVLPQSSIANVTPVQAAQQLDRMELKMMLEIKRLRLPSKEASVQVLVHSVHKVLIHPV